MSVVSELAERCRIGYDDSARCDKFFGGDGGGLVRGDYRHLHRGDRDVTCAGDLAEIDLVAANECLWSNHGT